MEMKLETLVEMQTPGVGGSQSGHSKWRPCSEGQERSQWMGAVCRETTLIKGLAVVSSCGSPSTSLGCTRLLSQMRIIIIESEHWLG